MKKLFCSQYPKDEVKCCKICHDDDSFFKSNYKNKFEISHCCCSLVDIVEDIKKHEEERQENNCE